MKERKNVFINCILTYTLLLAAAIPAMAQNIFNDIVFKNVPGTGLTNSYVTCINQDRNGFIWFGTKEGLYQYDGYVFTPFKNYPGDKQTLANNWILSLFPERGFLWVGSRGGLSRVNINTFQISNFKPAEPLEVHVIFPLNDSIFCIGASTGFFSFNKRTLAWKRMPGFSNKVWINAICDDKKGHLYLISGNGFFYYDKKAPSYCHYMINPTPVPNRITTAAGDTLLSLHLLNNFYNGYFDGQGVLWLPNWGAGLVNFDPRTGETHRWSHQTEDIEQLPYRIVTDVLPGDPGNIVLANHKAGLTIFNEKKNAFVNYHLTSDKEVSISDEVVSLFKDSDGILWVGTNNGIYKYDPHVVNLSRQILKNKKLIDPICMLKDKNGTFWLGSFYGIYLLDMPTGKLTDYSKQFGIADTLAVFNVLQDKAGCFWVTSRNKLVKVIETVSGKRVSFHSEVFQSPAIQSTITVLYIDGEGRIWAGTHQDGIFRFDPLLKKFISCHYDVPGLTTRINEIRSFCELSKDSLLIGGERTGLLLLTVTDGKYHQVSWKNDNNGLTQDQSVEAIYKTGQTIWVATEFSGLWESDSRFNRIHLHTTREGLPSLSIGALATGREGKLWILNRGGVEAFDLNRHRFDIYNEEDGIKENDLNALVPDSNGSIFFCSRGCVYKMNTTTMVKNNLPPKVYITKLSIFNKSWAIQNCKPIELKYDQNYVSLEYVGLNYTHSYLNKYAYKMQGLDKDWIFAGTRRVVSYVNLKDGTYVFKVKSANDQGVWSETPAVVVLIIHPPFWETWWAFSLYVILFAAAVYGFIYYRSRKLLKDKKRLESQVISRTAEVLKQKEELALQRDRLETEKIRAGIAADFHDELGSTLSSIALYSEMAIAESFHDQERTKNILALISESSRGTVAAMQDMIWAIQPKNDSIREVIYRMREYAYPMAELKNIKMDFEIGENVLELVLPMNIRKNAYLVFKEALNNAFKYASANHIIIRFGQKGHFLLMEIKDNGSGFEPAAINRGNGLNNMHKRAELAGGDLAVHTGKNQGTAIVFTCPIASA